MRWCSTGGGTKLDSGVSVSVRSTSEALPFGNELWSFVRPGLGSPWLTRCHCTRRSSSPFLRYMSEVVPMICEPGDDEQHGSSIICDINALQALSRRIHLGKFVAESKYQVRKRTLPCTVLHAPLVAFE